MKLYDLGVSSFRYNDKAAIMFRLGTHWNKPAFSFTSFGSNDSVEDK